MSDDKKSANAQILPSHYGRRSAGEQEKEGAHWDHDEQLLAYTEALNPPNPPATPIRRISPTTLAITTQCELRALWRARGEKGIGPSPFTRSVMDDGKEYESRLLEKSHLPIWIRAINQELGPTNTAAALPENMPGLIRGKTEKFEEYAQRCSQAFAQVLTKQKSPPFFIHEPRLATVEDGVLLQGQPDLLICTGNEWLFADIKCSEEAKRAHGMQIATYARIFEAMQPKQNKHPLGVVIHCAPGYRYTAASNAKEKQITLAHTQATSFPLDSLSGAVDIAVPLLAYASDEALAAALEKAVFSSVCVECEYRFRCYPRFLQQRHVSLVPLQKAELEAVMATGIRTIDDLLSAIDHPKTPAYQTLLELKDDSTLQLGYLREKAESVLRRGLYSSWRAASNSLTQPIFFVSVGDDFLFDPTPTEKSTPSCLVVYSEGERRRAWGKLLAIKKDWKMSTFVLSNEVQESLHGPLPSITLRPLAAILHAMKTYESFTKLYPVETNHDVERIQKVLSESPDALLRLGELKIVWDFLQKAALPFSL